DVGVLELVRLVPPTRPVPERRRQGRREALYLTDPIGDDTGRRDDERADVLFVLFQREQQRERLDRLAETHVVGEHAARPDVVDEPEPREPLLLVGTKSRLERAGLLRLAD